ncbi:MAG: ATP-dependent metallopeptidase FtsH/Yme1/Tma family protein, partial [Immundisolibacteraceae bacterium]|nr:ATP-dependent metallopeptidase FtsH/Yme1/Tma family protein [Immundisolibacteraceae bacterium]
MNGMAKNIVLRIVVVLVLMSVFSSMSTDGNQTNNITYSQFVGEVKSGSVQSVRIQGNSLIVTNRSGHHYEVYAPRDDELINDLLANGVEVRAEPPEGQ